MPADLDAAAFEQFLWDKFPPFHGIPLLLKRAIGSGKLIDLPEGMQKTPAGIRGKTKHCVYMLPFTEIPAQTVSLHYFCLILCVVSTRSV